MTAATAPVRTCGYGNRDLWIARHGTRIDTVNPHWHKTAIRPQDPRLAYEGIQEARALAGFMKDREIAHIFVREDLID